MKRFMLAIVLLSSFILTGCGLLTPTPVIAPTKYVVAKPTSDLLKTCATTPPPTVDAYMLLTKEAREKLLAEYSTALLNDLNECNLRWLALPKWFNDQSTAYGN